MNPAPLPTLPAFVPPPVMRMHIEDRSHRETMARLRKGGDAGRDEAARFLADVFVRRADDYSKRDTNRYRRGWAVAGNEAGAGLHVEPTLRPSEFRATYAARLKKLVASYNRRIRSTEESIEFFEERLNTWFRSRRQTLGTARGRGRKRKGMRRGKYPKEREFERIVKKKRATLERLIARRDRAQEQVDLYESNEYALFMGGSRGRIGKRGRLIGQRDISVRTKVYGGRGEVVRARGQTVFRLTNLEPHSRIIEKRDRVVYKASGDVMRLGGRRVGRAFFAEVEKSGAGSAARVGV